MLSRFLSLLFVAGPLVIWVASFEGCNPKDDTSPADAAGGSTKVQSSAGGSSVAGTAAGGSGGGGSANTGGSLTSTGNGGSAKGGSGGATRSGGTTGGSSGVDAGIPKDAAAKDTASDSVDARSSEAGAVKCDDITSNSRLGIWYYTGSGAATTQDVQVHLDVLNFTALSARLSQITVRYWFTDESPSDPNVIALYYVPTTISKLNAKFIPLNPPRTNADTVLEFSFAVNPDAGISFVETTDFNFSFHKDGYAGKYDQSNDYSFDPALTKALGANPKITAYINGVLAWGCEPPPAPPTAVKDASAGADSDEAEVQ
jgi:hypothetical protein